MPPKYVDATNFVDGLCAIATKVDGMVTDWHFMDTGLREVYPSIKTYPKQVGGKNYTIAPLRENRRAVYVAENAFSGAWGYLAPTGGWSYSRNIALHALSRAVLPSFRRATSATTSFS